MCKLIDDYAKEYAKDYAKKQKVQLLVNMIEKGRITKEEAAEEMSCTVEEFQAMRDEIMQLV